MTEEQEKTIRKEIGKAADAVWALGVPLVKAIDMAESEAQLLIIKTFIEFLGEQVEKKRQDLSDKEGK